MPGTDRIGVIRTNFGELGQVYQNMQAGDHLRGTPVSLYRQEGRQPDNPGFSKSSSYGDAKAHVRNIIAQTLGSGDKADDIMHKVLGNDQRRDGISRFWFPNRKAITKKQLGQIMTETLKAMSPEQASNLNLRIKSQTDYENWDPDVAVALRLQSDREYTTKNPEFLEAVHTFRMKVEAGGDLNELRAEARRIRDTYISSGSDEEINIAGGVRSAITHATIETMERDELQSLFDAAKRDIEGLMKDTAQRAHKVVGLNHLKVGNEIGINDLVGLKERIGDDEHLRQRGDVLYFKSNHPGVKDPGRLNRNHARPTWFGSRSSKFRTAKESVLKALTNTLGDEALARRILRPWLNSSRALTGGSLDRIVDITKARVKVEQSVTSLVQQDPNPPTLKELIENRPKGWSDAFAAVCAANHKKGVLDDARDLITLENKLLEADSTGDWTTSERLSREWLKDSAIPDVLRNELTSLLETPASRRNSARLRVAIQQYQLTRVSALKTDFKEFQGIVHTAQRKIQKERLAQETIERQEKLDRSDSVSTTQERDQVLGQLLTRELSKRGVEPESPLFESGLQHVIREFDSVFPNVSISRELPELFEKYIKTETGLHLLSTIESADREFQERTESVSTDSSDPLDVILEMDPIEEPSVAPFSTQQRDELLSQLLAQECGRLKIGRLSAGFDQGLRVVIEALDRNSRLKMNSREECEQAFSTLMKSSEGEDLLSRIAAADLLARDRDELGVETSVAQIEEYLTIQEGNFGSISETDRNEIRRIINEAREIVKTNQGQNDEVHEMLRNAYSRAVRAVSNAITSQVD